MEKLNEKVFGLILIIALGIIFIPMFFASENKHLAKKNPQAESVASLDNEEPRILTELEQKIQEKPISHGTWAIQLGTFDEPKDAAAFILKLKKQGFAAFSHHTTIDGKALTIVYVGPIVRKKDATKLMATLASKFEIQGSIVYHTVGL